MVQMTWTDNNFVLDAFFGLNKSEKAANQGS